MRARWASLGSVLLLCSLVTFGWACATAPPRNPENACDIFAENLGWYSAARDTERRWSVPAGLQLAIVYQESSFDARARPPRGRILWVIPGPRPSSAYGYGQVVDGTWDRYRDSTGRNGADRDTFADVSDFIGWYGSELRRAAGVEPDDALSFYLAYHEGPYGFVRRSFEDKPWLTRVANRVSERARRYELQLTRCRNDLDERVRRPWWWPF